MRYSTRTLLIFVAVIAGLTAFIRWAMIASQTTIFVENQFSPDRLTSAEREQILIRAVNSQVDNKAKLTNGSFINGAPVENEKSLFKLIARIGKPNRDRFDYGPWKLVNGDQVPVVEGDRIEYTIIRDPSISTTRQTVYTNLHGGWFGSDYLTKKYSDSGSVIPAENARTYTFDAGIQESRVFILDIIDDLSPEDHTENLSLQISSLMEAGISTSAIFAIAASDTEPNLLMVEPANCSIPFYDKDWQWISIAGQSYWSRIKMSYTLAPASDVPKPIMLGSNEIVNGKIPNIKWGFESANSQPMRYSFANAMWEYEGWNKITFTQTHKCPNVSYYGFDALPEIDTTRERYFYKPYVIRPVFILQQNKCLPETQPPPSGYIQGESYVDSEQVLPSVFRGQDFTASSDYRATVVLYKGPAPP
jgi:hypothetical protein